MLKPLFIQMFTRLANQAFPSAEIAIQTAAKELLQPIQDRDDPNSHKRNFQKEFYVDFAFADLFKLVVFAILFPSSNEMLQLRVDKTR